MCRRCHKETSNKFFCEDCIKLLTKANDEYQVYRLRRLARNSPEYTSKAS